MDAETDAAGGPVPIAVAIERAIVQNARAVLTNLNASNSVKALARRWLREHGHDDR